MSLLFHVHNFLLAFMSLYQPCARCPSRSKEGIGSLKTGATDGCEPQFGRFEPNPGPIKEQQVLSTTELPSSAPESTLNEESFRC